MKVWLNRFLAIGLAAAFILTVASQANAARRAGLHGNQLIKDVSDINTYPQAASNYRNLFRIDMGDATPSDPDDDNSAATVEPSAWFVVGDDSATYGVRVHGPAFVGLMEDPECPPGVDEITGDAIAGVCPHVPMPNPVPTVLSMVYSMPMGADSLGVGLSLGMGGNTPKEGPASSAMNIGLTIGYSMGAMNLDTALSVQMDSWSDGADKESTKSDMTIGVNARGYHSLGEGTDLGYLVGFKMANTGGDFLGEAGGTTSAMDVTLGAGPVYKMDKGQVAAYGTLSFESDTETFVAIGDKAAKGDATSTKLGFPGVLVSAEVWLSDNLVWRGGASYGYSMDTDEFETASKSNSSGWSSGLGYKWDKFQIDGALSKGFYNNGPHFISGAGPVLTDGDGESEQVQEQEQSSLFTHVSASYSF